MIKASVVVPIYNQCERLLFALKGYNSQSADRSSFEVIVIDDGSTDNIDDVYKNLQVNYNLKWIKMKKNSGRSNARNIGVQEAEGEIIIFCDGDRIPSTEFIQSHIKAHELHGINSIVMGGIVELFISDFESRYLDLYNFQSIEDLTKNIRVFNYADCVNKLFNEFGYTDSKLRWLTFLTGNCSVSKNNHNMIGGFDTNFISWGFEDTEYGYRLYKNDVPFFLDQSATSYHIFHTSDRTNSRREASYNYFLNKYNTSDIGGLLDFLNGALSLQEYEKIVGSKTLHLINEEDIFFKPNKFGRRYVSNIT